MDPAFWKGKKVLLTGHTGFKGSWLSIWLQKLGVKLIGFSKSIPTKPSLFELANVDKGMTSIMGNVCDYKLVEKIVLEYKPEIIIHMAAQAILRESYKDPVETYSTNVMGTVNILESFRKVQKVGSILIVTSDKCYDVREFSQSFKEDDPMGGYDPYSSSKGCAELVTSSFRNSFFNPTEHSKHGVSIASVRAGNVIGGGDWGSDRLIPDVIREILNDTQIKIRNPNAVRPWQYILDLLNGYLLLTEKLWSHGPEFSQAWNFGPAVDDSKPVQWIIEKMKELWDRDIKWELDTTENPHETTFLRLDSSKARSRLGWLPKMNLEDGLKWTIDWYKQFEQKKDLRKFSEKQIDNFLLL